MTPLWVYCYGWSMVEDRDKEAEMFLETVKSPGLAHLSYICGDAGKAAVVDPRRDYDIYLEVAAREGCLITHIFETHRNEDYVVGSTYRGRAFRRRCGKYRLSPSAAAASGPPSPLPCSVSADTSKPRPASAPWPPARP